MKFPSFKKGKEFFLVLDIGTEAVKSLILKNEGKKRIILGSSLKYFDQFKIFDGQLFEMDIIQKAISEVIIETQKETGKKLESVVLGLPLNVLKGKIVSLSFQRKNPKYSLNKKEEKKIQEEIIEKTKKLISQDFAREVGILPQDIQFLTFKVLEIRIDGYPVPNLQGFTGTNLDFKILTTFLLKSYFKNIKKISQALNLKIVNMAHEVQGLIFFLDKEPESIFIDIGGDFTQIFLVRQKKLERIEEIEIGGRDFSQTLSQALGLPEIRARILKERYSKGYLSEEVRRRIKEILAPSLEDWFGKLRNALSKGKLPLPLNIILFGGGSLLPDIQEVLIEGDWKSNLFLTQPEVRILSPEDLTEQKLDRGQNIKESNLSANPLLNSPQNIPSLLICYAPT